MRAVDTRRDTDNAGIVVVVDGEVGGIGKRERPGKSDFHSVFAALTYSTGWEERR
jgi:hypothetical protein